MRGSYTEGRDAPHVGDECAVRIGNFLHEQVAWIVG